MTYSRFTRCVLTLAVGGFAAACAADLTAPVDEGPTLESRWDIDVVIRYLHASTELTCDGKTIIGTPNPGEYQYRITAKYGSTSKSDESNGYGTVGGASRELSPNENWNITNKTWTFENLRQGEAVALTMSVTEWDGPSRDSYMNNLSNTLQLDPSSLAPSGGTRTGRALGVGNSTCGLTLYYDITVRQRQVQVS